MEAFLKNQIKATLKLLPYHITASYFKSASSPEVERLRRRTGGFIKGVCHCWEDYGRIQDAGLGWEREDIPFPFDKDGNLTERYLSRKEEWRRHRESGVRIFALTPWPNHYAANGVDPRLPENEARIREIAVFMLNDLRGIVDAIQVSNEMGVPRFTRPLTVAQGARFIGIQLAAMYPHRGDILIGYNSGGPQCDLHDKMRPWHQYCDYVGLDMYVGCFTPAANWMYVFEALLRYLWSLTGKPILLCEFGYLGGGVPRTKAEKRAILQRYGVSSEREAREKIDMVMENIKKLNPKMYDYAVTHASGGYADFLFKLDYCNHFYSELPRTTVIRKYPHTPEGQAGFYRDIFPRLAKLPFLLGAFVYCWQDSERCCVCGQDDCPTETRWGLVDMQHNEKPSYYAVRDALAGIK